MTPIAFRGHLFSIYPGAGPTECIRRFSEDAKVSYGGAEKWWYGSNEVPGTIEVLVKLMLVVHDVSAVLGGGDTKKTEKGTPGAISELTEGIEG